MDEINSRLSMGYFQNLGFIGLVIVAGGIGLWSVLSSIQGAIIASGIIKVEGYSKKVQHSEGGIVTRIEVKDGDRVEAGDLLIALDETELRAQVDILDARIAENLSKAARLKALRDDINEITFPKEVMNQKDKPQVAEILAGQENLFNSLRNARTGRTSQLQERILQSQKEIVGHEAQIRARKDQSDLISSELIVLEKLFKRGLVSVTRLLALKRERANLNGQLGEIEANIAKTHGRISEIKLQIIQMNNDDLSKDLTELRDVESQLAELKERLIAAQAKLKRLNIRAPQSGFVHQLAVHTINGVISAGEVTMLIVPDIDNLVIEAQIDPRDIDNVRVGQSARLRFTTFAQRTTPELFGEVSFVSADVSQTDRSAPPFFMAKIKIRKQELKKLGDNQLIPGMPAEVFIQTTAYAPIDYLLKPLKDQIERAFREN